MAIKSLHARITRTVLKEFGFSKSACEIAAEANMLVDKYQGNRPQDTHLHAMRGVLPNRQGRLVAEDRAKAVHAIQALIDDARREILKDFEKLAMLKPGKTMRAEAELILQKIGRVFHTIQDKEFHHFGVWSHGGMLQAALADPLALAMHGVHDLGNTYMAIRASSGDMGRWGVRTTFGVSLSQQHNVHIYGSIGATGGGGQRNKGTLTGGLCFGACGSTRPTRSSYTPPGPLGKSTQMKTEGGVNSGAVNRVRSRAVKATQQFFENLRQQVDHTKPGLWQQFIDVTR